MLWWVRVRRYSWCAGGSSGLLIGKECCVLHILLVGRWGDMYCSQSIIQPLHQAQPKASLVDNMVNLKGETGVVGFVYYTSVHSFFRRYPHVQDKLVHRG